MWDTQSFHRPTDRSQIQLCIFIYQYLFYRPSGRESSRQCRRCRKSGFNPWVGKILWRRNWQPTPVILPVKCHEQRSLVSHSPWGRKELDTAKHAHTLILQHRLVKPLKTCSFKKTRTNFANYKLYIDSKTYDMILAHSSLSWTCTKDRMTCQYYCHKHHNQSISQFSHSVMSDSLWSHGQQHVRLPCPSPTSRACSNSCPLTQWCHPTISSRRPLLLPSIFPSIRVFSNESVFLIRWPKYRSFSFSISPSNEFSGLISFRIDWLDLLAVQGTLKSLLQHHSSETLLLGAQLSLWSYSHVHIWILEKP